MISAQYKTLADKVKNFCQSSGWKCNIFQKNDVLTIQIGNHYYFISFADQKYVLKLVIQGKEEILKVVDNPDNLFNSITFSEISYNLRVG